MWIFHYISRSEISFRSFRVYLCDELTLFLSGRWIRWTHKRMSMSQRVRDTNNNNTLPLWAETVWTQWVCVEHLHCEIFGKWILEKWQHCSGRPTGELLPRSQHQQQHQSRGSRRTKWHESRWYLSKIKHPTKPTTIICATHPTQLSGSSIRSNYWTNCFKNKNISNSSHVTITSCHTFTLVSSSTDVVLCTPDLYVLSVLLLSLSIFLSTI